VCGDGQKIDIRNITVKCVPSNTSERQSNTECGELTRATTTTMTTIDSKCTFKWCSNVDYDTVANWFDGR